MSGEPYTKAQQLGAQRKRYRRKVASAKTWARIADEKRGPCRVCLDPCRNGRLYGRVELHHLIPRGSPWFGDDVPENIAPLCPSCHLLVTTRSPIHCKALLGRLTDAEYAYAVTKGGEDVFERVYGITYAR